MTTAFKFTSYLDISCIPKPTKAVGAHLAAKLQLFNTDKRTLTDELCDMLCIWLGLEGGKARPTHPSKRFKITLGKTTIAEEVENGADLELVISSPLGIKRCLIQAKVLDSSTNKLRCDSKAGWEKLRTQLVAARNEVGDLAFLLIYIPGGVLNRNRYGYGTYEQRTHYPSSGFIPSYFGATLIPVSKLIDASDNWLDTKLKVSQISKGRFKDGVALWRVLMELLTCRRSKWKKPVEVKLSDRLHAFRRLSIDASDINERDWEIIQMEAEQFLPSEESDDDIDNFE